MHGAKVGNISETSKKKHKKKSPKPLPRVLFYTRLKRKDGATRATLGIN